MGIGETLYYMKEEVNLSFKMELCAGVSANY
jgi:hypothetical protein